MRDYNTLRRRTTDLPELLRAGAALVLALVLWVGTSRADPAIAPGSATLARDYYVRISKELGFEAQPGVTTLDGLLSFAGYPSSGLKVEALDPAILMSPQRAASSEGLGVQGRGLAGAALRAGDILAARFFAPKIANVNTSAPVPGWRKLVRLRTRPDSQAARAGVQAVVILFNFFASATDPQPFAGHSGNTQVMLLAPAMKDRLYWLDFDGTGKLGLALNQTFDAADLTNGTTRDYFVPDGCNACHGSPGNHSPPMVNYLDTDHWFDRLDDDFVSLKAAGTPLLFDAGTNDSSQPAFHSAFDVLRQFNEEALAQNSLVRPKSFEAQAARTWLKLHAQADDHKLPVDRGFSMDGGPVWQAAEASGLAKLNRYCFRCHGSVRFSIFDRPAVVGEAGTMRQRIKPSKPQSKVSGFKMPPDRDLDPGELEALDGFLRTVR